MSTDREPHDPVPPVARRRPRPQPNFWWSLLACVGLLLIQTIGLVAVWVVVWLVLCATTGDEFQTALQNDLSGLQRVSSPTPPGEEPPVMPPRMAAGMMTGLLGGHLAVLGYTMLLVRWVFGRGWPRVVALRRPSAAQLLVAWVIFLPGLMFAAEGLYALLLAATGSNWNPNMQVAMTAADAAPVWLALMAVAVGPGLVEELFCRGFIGRGLVGRHGWVLGVLLTAALFGLLHLDPLYSVVTAVLGVGLHFSLATSRSLWVPVVLHATNNALSVLATRLPAAFDVPTAPWQVGVRYGSAAALLALGAWALWSCRATLAPASDAAGDWRPRFPGVAHPPPESGLVVVHGRLNLLPVLLAPLPLTGVIWSVLPVN